MSEVRTPDGGHAEALDETNSQPGFVGRLALVLAVLACLFGIVTIIAGLSFHA